MDDRISNSTLYAVIKDNIVDNVIDYHEDSNYKPPEGFELIKCTEETGVPHIGLRYENGIFEQPVYEVGIGHTPK